MAHLASLMWLSTGGVYSAGTFPELLRGIPRSAVASASERCLSSRLRRRQGEPAAGPILTTVTDMCGFFLALSFAALLLGRLA